MDCRERAAGRERARGVGFKLTASQARVGDAIVDGRRLAERTCARLCSGGQRECWKRSDGRLLSRAVREMSTRAAAEGEEDGGEECRMQQSGLQGRVTAGGSSGELRAPMYLPAVTGTGKGSTMDDSADGRGKTAKARMGIKWDKERGEERR
jgi:hypothetical protein